MDRRTRPWSSAVNPFHWTGMLNPGLAPARCALNPRPRLLILGLELETSLHRQHRKQCLHFHPHLAAADQRDAALIDQNANAVQRDSTRAERDATLAQRDAEAAARRVEAAAHQATADQLAAAQN